MKNLIYKKMNNAYKLSLLFMVFHAILVIVWNIVGVWLISHGKSALGPTATLTGALLFAVLIAAYLIIYRKGLEKVFLILVIIGALLGSIAIYSAFTKDHTLWPSEFWRYAGVAVNSLGVIGFLFALKDFLIGKHLK